MVAIVIVYQFPVIYKTMSAMYSRIAFDEFPRLENFGIKL